MSTPANHHTWYCPLRIQHDIYFLWEVLTHLPGVQQEHRWQGTGRQEHSEVNTHSYIFIIYTYFGISMYKHLLQLKYLTAEVQLRLDGALSPICVICGLKCDSHREKVVNCVWIYSTIDLLSRSSQWDVFAFRLAIPEDRQPETRRQGRS